MLEQCELVKPLEIIRAKPTTHRTGYKRYEPIPIVLAGDAATGSTWSVVFVGIMKTIFIL